MKDFEEKVAVITGAASGIGLALAEACVERGMQVVMADVETTALNAATARLRERGATVVAQVTDVSQAAEVDRLKEEAISAFGAVHLVCNNAGVAAGTTVWESSAADWEWVLGVNLWGVINGCRAFLPGMLEQESGGHVVNTASIAGVLPHHPCAPYLVTKHAVVGLSEQLYHSLAAIEARVRVSVLCPGWVRTGIMSSARNRPARLLDGPRQPADAGQLDAFGEDTAQQFTVVEPAAVA